MSCRIERALGTSLAGSTERLICLTQQDAQRWETEEEGGWGLLHIRGQGGLTFELGPERGGSSYVEESEGEHQAEGTASAK